MKPVVQITSVETIVTTARTTINVVQAKNVVTTNAPIHVFRMLDHCRRCHWYNNFLRHNHFHCILLLLSCCPYYRYRTAGTVVVTPQLYQPYVSNHTHMIMTQQIQAPPPVNYNQPLPGYLQPPSGHNQPPPPYPSYPPPSTQHPPPQG